MTNLKPVYILVIIQYRGGILDEGHCFLWLDAGSDGLNLYQKFLFLVGGCVHQGQWVEVLLVGG